MASKQGVGFRLYPGALSHIEQSGGIGDRRSVLVNLAADPFVPDGTRNKPEGNETLARLKLQRYMGGDERFQSYVPQGVYGERGWMANKILEAMYVLWSRGENVNRPGVYYFEGRPEDHTGIATARECEDYRFTVTRPESDRLWDRLIAGTGTPSPKPDPIQKPADPKPVDPVQPTQPNQPETSPPAAPAGNTDLTEIVTKLARLESGIADTGRKIDALTQQVTKQLRTLLNRSKPK